MVTKQLRHRGIYLLPNMFTTAALFAGFYAIVAGMKGFFDNAAMAIYIAMILDALDGRVARLTNTQTDFGAQLDSLSDMVSFGVAPALVIYSWALGHLGKLGWLAAFVYAVAGALRLARFNVQAGNADKRYFQGLPIPAAAGVIAGMVWSGNEFGITGHSIGVLVAIITVAVGALMVSNMRYRSFKDLNLKNNVPFVAIIIAVLILIFIAIDPPQVLFLTFFVYAASGPIVTLWQLRKWRRVRRRNKKSS